MFPFFNRWGTNLNLDADAGAGGSGDDEGGDDGDKDGTAPAWMAQLPDDLKEDEDLAKFPKLGEFAKSHKELTVKVQELEGKLPKVPEKAEEYTFGKVEYPEGYEADPGFDAAFRALALEHGLTAAQADAVYQHFASTVVGQYNAAVAAAEKAKTDAAEALKKDWPGDDFAKNMALKDRFIAAFAEGNDELKAWFDESDAGNQVPFIKMAVDIAKKIGEDSLGPGGPKGDEPKPADEEADLRAMYPKSKDIPYRAPETAKPETPEHVKGAYPSMEQ